MKHKQTFIFIVLAVVCIFLMFGCSASRKSVEKTETIEVSEQSSRLAKDEMVIDYSIDTTKECEQTISYEFVEYYPDYDTSTFHQPVRSIKKKVVTTRNKSIGTSSTTIEKSNIDSTYTQISSNSDSRKVLRNPSINPSLWWLVFLLAVVAIILGIVFKVKR